MPKFVKGDLICFHPPEHNENIIGWRFLINEDDWTAFMFTEGTMAVYLEERIINDTKFHEVLIEMKKYCISHTDINLYVDKYSY